MKGKGYLKRFEIADSSVWMENIKGAKTKMERNIIYINYYENIKRKK